MPNNKKPFYTPIPTKRNKLVLKEMIAGTVVLIDVINSEIPYNRSVAKSWREAQENPTKADIIWFENGPAGERVKYGSVDEVRELMEISDTVL